MPTFSPTGSPLPKCSKLNTPSKSVHKRLFTEINTTHEQEVIAIKAMAMISDNLMEVKNDSQQTDSGFERIPSDVNEIEDKHILADTE